LNYTHRKPYIPLPPALPRFALPHEVAGAKGEAEDPMDAAATQQRPALHARGSMSGVRSRRIVRKKLVADSTEEVQVEDILLEAYAEEPPPPLTRRSAGVPPLPTESARESIALAIASAVPPPSQSAAVDALLRASDPAFAPYPYPQPYAPAPYYSPHSPHSQHSQHAPHSQHSQPPQGQGFVNPYESGYRTTDFESVSVAPVMLATTVPPPARPVFANARANRVNRAAVVAIWSSVLLVLGVALGAAVVLGVWNGTYARLRDTTRAKSATVHAPTAAAAAPVAPAVADTPVVAPAPAPAPVPSISVEALAAPPIPPDSSLVTFPAYAQGHRVFIDGRIVAVAEGTPTKLKCGRHMVKIGAARKARVLDFACGREVLVK
jgi:hypothetical protein